MFRELSVYPAKSSIGLTGVNLSAPAMTKSRSMKDIQILQGSTTCPICV